MPPLLRRSTKEEQRRNIRRRVLVVASLSSDEMGRTQPACLVWSPVLPPNRFQQFLRSGISRRYAIKAQGRLFCFSIGTSHSATGFHHHARARCSPTDDKKPHELDEVILKNTKKMKYLLFGTTKSEGPPAAATYQRNNKREINIQSCQDLFVTQSEDYELF